MGERGVIRNREAKRQIVDMSGLRYGKITPTDLDAFLDFGNRLFVFVECKYMNAPLSYGQRLAIERLVDACHMPPQRYAVAFVVEHNGGEADIDFAGTTVRQYRWDGKWLAPKIDGSSLREGVDAFRDRCLSGNARLASNVVPIRAGR